MKSVCLHHYSMMEKLLYLMVWGQFFSVPHLYIQVANHCPPFAPPAKHRMCWELHLTNYCPMVNVWKYRGGKCLCTVWHDWQDISSECIYVKKCPVMNKESCSSGRVLTQLPLEDLGVILKMQFTILFYWLVSIEFYVTMPQALLMINQH